MNNSGIIFLTSTGLSSENVYNKFEEISDKEGFKNAVIITTAAFDKEKNKYSQLALSQLKSVGFDMVDFYDFENDGVKDLSKYDVVYVCGGNTFKLMKFARELHFEKEIDSLLKRGGAYVGVSAGSIIVGPSIEIADQINPDPNEVGTTDFKGFGITNLIIFPHYSLEFEEQINRFEYKYNVNVERIDNSQAVIFENGLKTLLK